MQTAEQTLKEDDPGVCRRILNFHVPTFLDLPPEKGYRSNKEDNSCVFGFRGGKSAFWIRVRPSGKGFKQRTKGEADIYLLFRSDSDIKMRVEWSVSIIDPHGSPLQTSVILSTIFEKKDGQYQNDQLVVFIPSGRCDIRLLEDAKFGLRKDITEKGCLFDGALHVAADVRFKILEGGYPETSAAVHPFLSALKNQLDNPIFPDFTLISADGEHIKIHKVILTLQSPVFRAMFENNLEEARSGVCKIEDADAKCIKAMLGFLVGAEPKEWNFDLAQDLFELADKYQLADLLDRSAMELSKLLNTKNLPDVLLLAYQHSAKALLNDAFCFLEENIMKATLDGVIVRISSKDFPEALVREWQAHWFRRQKGIEMEDDDEDDEMDSSDDCNAEDNSEEE